MNITEDYVSFEVAKLLNEKGFDEKTLSYYEDNVLCRGDWFEWNRSPLGHIAAPTHQMAMKWLREAHKLSIEPYSIAIEENRIGYAYSICSCETGLEMFAERWDGKNPFTTYEQAVEAALKYSLENLI